ncbi:hypothetical protein BBJ41_27500 [Burkholderia stabilis]|uniref:Uncharacterized protein n=1 Tax=Burkholderia stabilis TaxID=95485 RepID=A0AAJ5T717_9BURK|nr:hypothetical protein [Burkholderia stabilis]AOR71226.1 hypothetical protein BBJ41_27500 [Burkholderia stabilis]VBB15301.1 hypothetical protein BSTAB16_5497 [Burkholderia stabilis]HDR9490832.1 hypothetical protein [Burkholderia stabilis]HDR9525889.1 hypothetical protein [Burkholderia stabilis]HDR9531860.1 hypothetical protein [Burkholderia stabilis]
MKSKTTRLLRILSDIRHAQRCTAMRAARAAAEADAVLAEHDDPAADERDEAESDDATTVPRSRIGSPH